MKKNFLWVAALATLALMGCERLDFRDQKETVDVTFRVEGDFSAQKLTRATGVRETTMTDLWVFDYVEGELVQTIHQESVDEDFGVPTLPLSMGSHDLYFVCSAGGTPTLNTDAHKLTWAVPRDTFWKKLTKNISSNTEGTATVTLDRITTRLTVNIEDAIPTGMAKLEIQPSTWYYGLDYLTGNGTDTRSQAFTITIPASYAGRTNTKVGIYGMALASEFTTNVTLTAKDGDDNLMATETITAAPMQKNRSTDYTGTLFLSQNGYTVNINDEWEQAYEASW